jgi:hypothetical protein
MSSVGKEKSEFPTDGIAVPRMNPKTVGGFDLGPGGKVDSFKKLGWHVAQGYAQISDSLSL